MARAKTVQDDDGNAIQALHPATDRTFFSTLTIGGTAVSAQLADHSDVFRLAADVDCWVMFGDSGVAAQANDILFQAGAEVFTRPPGATHISVIQRAGSSGVLNVVPVGS